MYFIFLYRCIEEEQLNNAHLTNYHLNHLTIRGPMNESPNIKATALFAYNYPTQANTTYIISTNTNYSLSTHERLDQLSYDLRNFLQNFLLEEPSTDNNFCLKDLREQTA